LIEQFGKSQSQNGIRVRTADRASPEMTILTRRRGGARNHTVSPRSRLRVSDSSHPRRAPFHFCILILTSDFSSPHISLHDLRPSLPPPATVHQTLGARFLLELVYLQGRSWGAEQGAEVIAAGRVQGQRSEVRDSRSMDRPRARRGALRRQAAGRRATVYCCCTNRRVLTTTDDKAGTADGLRPPPDRSRFLSYVGRRTPNPRPAAH